MEPNSVGDMQQLASCMAAIVTSLKALGYRDPHPAGLRNEAGEVILAISPDGGTHFAIQVRTWKPTTDEKVSGP